jgi:hypothetical protein
MFAHLILFLTGATFACGDEFASLVFCDTFAAIAIE